MSSNDREDWQNKSLDDLTAKIRRLEYFVGALALVHAPELLKATELLGKTTLLVLGVKVD